MNQSIEETPIERAKRLTPSDLHRALYLATRPDGVARICPGVPVLEGYDSSQIGGGASLGAQFFATIHAGIEADAPRIAALNKRLAARDAENEQLRATIRQMAGKN